MKIKNIIYIFLFIIIILVGTILMASALGNEKEASVFNYEEMLAESGYPGIDIITEILIEDHYKMAVNYPDFHNDYLNKEVLEYVSISKEEFLNEVELNKKYLTEKDFLGTLYLNFNIYEVLDDTYSIVITNESFVGGANWQQSSKVLMVNKKDNQFIYPEDILKDDLETRLKISDLLLTAFQKSEEYKDFFFEEELFDWIEGEENSNRKIFIAENNLVFKFDKYEVTAGAAGSPEISFPIQDMKEIVRQEWLENMYGTEDINLEDQSDALSHIDDEKKEDNQTADNKKKVALTFDDGPHPKNTLKILQLLEDYEMKGTFFMLGSRIDFYPEITKKIAREGHEVGNHTWNHKLLTKMSEEDIKNEINSVDQILEKLIGDKSTVFRPPYGETNEYIDSLVSVPSVLWTIDTLDWKSHNPKEILEIVKRDLKPNAIILMHDIHETTVEAVALVLAYLESEDYISVKVSEVL